MTDMLTSFNADFGSQYDKDVLKTRYTNLWKQFNDVKSLLSHFGFSWDASRQMVVAAADDDSVCDAYLKSHPDARCYRTKPVLNFDDLCVIYGHTVADGRYSLSSHDVNLDDQVQGQHLDDGMGSIAVPSSERARTDWTASMEQFFIEFLLDQLGRGNQVDNGFNKNAWTDMLAIFNAKFGCQHGRRVLKNRFKKRLKHYCDITNLIKQGFLWDEQQLMLLADDDVWNAYVKAHLHAGTYRSKTLPNYCDLELIFRNMAENEISNLQQEKNHEDVISETKAGEAKGSRNPSGTDRTRTYWTPPMDRCLIDLLLEQNRYKHFRKQFNDVDHLLQQGGFSWDDTIEMIDAEDHVWDAYTKAHPEAPPLRVKTLPDYWKWSVIFAAESSDTRYVHLAHNEDHSSELPMYITGEQKNGICSNVYDAGSTIEWTESMECYFVDIMIEQVNRGNRIENLFNEEAWMHMVQAFNARWGLQSDKQVLMDQYFCLMKKHDDISNILSHSEFAWNETLQTINAEDDVWDAYIKIFGNKLMEVPDVRVSDLEQLHLMEANDFTIEMDMDEANENLLNISSVDISDQNPGRTREMDTDGSFANLGVTSSSATSGNLDVTSSNATSNQNTERPREMDMDMTSGNLDVTGDAQILSQDEQSHDEMVTNGTCGNLELSGNTKMTQHFRKRPNMMSQDSRPPKKKLGMKEALSEMASAVKALMNDKENNDTSFDDALSALRAMPDVDDELVMDACDLLEDERKANIFLALDISLRKKWLLRKLRQEKSHDSNCI
ncbi:L10-interacting MYB domain-containing protein [Glycine soja]|uniref:L10-interacting MYB domain-containing protein n=1 Tax=Glycine soja TaxID=3848 RepID=A0A445K5M0_GLYSO|nr:L10-interacting MYB domain-containing protein [Glycine soja]